MPAELIKEELLSLGIDSVSVSHVRHKESESFEIIRGRFYYDISFLKSYLMFIDPVPIIVTKFVEGLIYHHVKESDYENLFKLWNNLPTYWCNYCIEMLKLDEKVDGFVGYAKQFKYGPAIQKLYTVLAHFNLLHLLAQRYMPRAEWSSPDAMYR